jgi:signal transduction histidine kinase
MQSRAKRLGGSLVVGRNEGGGTRVRLELPLKLATGECAT